MGKQNNLEQPKLKRAIRGMSSQTFVKGYKTQSQMDVNTITGICLSSRGGKIMESIRGTFDEHE